MLRERGALPFEQKLALRVNYAQLITRPFICEAGFVFIQVFGRKPDGQHSTDAELAVDKRCDSRSSWLHRAAGGRGRNRVGLGSPSPVTSQLGRFHELFERLDDLDVSGHSTAASNGRARQWPAVEASQTSAHSGTENRHACEHVWWGWMTTTGWSRTATLKLESSLNLPPMILALVTVALSVASRRPLRSYDWLLGMFWT